MLNLSPTLAWPQPIFSELKLRWCQVSYSTFLGWAVLRWPCVWPEWQHSCNSGPTPPWWSWGRTAGGALQKISRTTLGCTSAPPRATECRERTGGRGQDRASIDQQELTNQNISNDISIESNNSPSLHQSTGDTITSVFSCQTQTEFLFLQGRCLLPSECISFIWFCEQAQTLMPI